MKKAFFLVPAVAATAMIFTGCAMCTDPIDMSCTEASHELKSSVDPSALSLSTPTIVPTIDTFRPVFRSGTTRTTATGTGTSYEQALNEAIINFKKLANCDYVVAVNIDTKKNTHPTWRFWATSSYTVTLTGLPITLDKLLREEKKPVAPKPVVVVKQLPPPPPPKPQQPQLTAKDITIIIQKELAKKQNLGLLKLTDIDVQIKAKGCTRDDVGVVFPADK